MFTTIYTYFRYLCSWKKRLHLSKNIPKDYNVLCQCPRMFACTPAQNVKLPIECELILSKIDCLWHSMQHWWGALIHARHTMSCTHNTFLSFQEIYLQSLIHPKILLVYYETQLFNRRMSLFFFFIFRGIFSSFR